MLNLIYIWSAVATAFFLPLSTAATDVLFLVCPILFFLTGQWREKFLFIWHTRALLLMAVLFGWMIVGMTYATVPFQEALAGLFKYDKLLLGVFFVPAFAQEKHRKYALYAFLLAIAVTMLAAILKETGWFFAGEKFGRFLVFKDRIQTSFLTAFSAYFSLVLFFNHPKSAARSKWLYLMFCLLSIFFLFSIGGRSGYVVFLVLLTWLFWDRWRWQGLLSAIMIGAVVTLSAYLFSTAFNARLQESVHDIHVYQQGQSDTSLGLRFEFAKNSLQIIKQHPVFGSGTGSFSAQYASLKTPAYLGTNNPHDQYIHVLVQWGVVGLLLLLGLFYVQWRDSKLLPPTMYQVARGVVLAIAVGSLANSWLLDTTEGHFYAYFMALTFASLVSVSRHQ